MIKTFNKERLAMISKKLDYETILELFEEYEINTENRIAAFFAQVMHESVDFKYKEENLNYSEKGLKAVFGKYYKEEGLAKKHAYKPVTIASYVYANRMGNGDASSQDGYRFRGRGYIQLTGRDNYTSFANDKGMDLEQAIDYLITPKGAMESALWFWKRNHINELCDKEDFKAVCCAVNGGLNGYDDRKKKYDKFKAILEK